MKTGGAMLLGAALAACAAMHGQSDLQRDVREIVLRNIRRDGAPSASVAVVVNGNIVLAVAGNGSLRPARRATADTRYQLASISKSMTAHALLLLEAEGKLSLDAPVSQWFPRASGAADITVRQLLTHTAGEPSHYPMAYPAGPRAHAAMPDDIIAQWSSHPLLFPPGTQFRYGNLDYVMAGRIAEMASGMPLFQLMQQRIFQPLEMEDVADLDHPPPDSATMATGYVRIGLSPLSPAPYEGPGWSFGAGQVVATASALAKWDKAFLARRLLPPTQSAEQLTPVKLKDGSTYPYALGLFVSASGGTRRVYHSGQGLGFLALNDIYPDANVAIVVLTNTSSGDTYLRIADEIRYLVVPLTEGERAARDLFVSLQRGRPDRSLFTEDLDAYLRGKTLGLLRDGIAQLGPVRSLVSTGDSTTDGLRTRSFDLTAGSTRLRLSLLSTAEGRLEDITIAPVE